MRRQQIGDQKSYAGEERIRRKNRDDRGNNARKAAVTRMPGTNAIAVKIAGIVQKMINRLRNVPRYCGAAYRATPQASTMAGIVETAAVKCWESRHRFGMISMIEGLGTCV